MLVWLHIITHCGTDCSVQILVECCESFSLNVVFIYSSLPELLEKKRLVDLHTNVATAILEQIKVIDCCNNFRLQFSVFTV